MKKKRKIIAAITAVAVAAAGLFIPAEVKPKNGFNIEASANEGDLITEGGLEIVYLGDDPDNEPDYDYDIDTLGVSTDEYVLLRVVVPDLTTSLPDHQFYTDNSVDPPVVRPIPDDERGLDSAKFTILYDKDVFELQQWYYSEKAIFDDNDTKSVNWPKLANILHGSLTYATYDENKGELYAEALTNGTKKVNGLFFGQTDENGRLKCLEAKFKVTTAATIRDAVFSLKNENELDIDFAYLDENGLNPVQIWKPENNNKGAFVNIAVTDTLQIYIKGYADDDLNVFMFSNYLNDNTEVRPGNLNPQPTVLKTKTISIDNIRRICDIYVGQEDVGQEEGADTDGIYYKFRDSFYDSNGIVKNLKSSPEPQQTYIYKFTGVYDPENLNQPDAYTLLINRWCTYKYKRGNTDFNDDDGYLLKIERKSDTEVRINGETKTADYVLPVEVRLYGDVDGINGVDVLDVTKLLRTLVGKTLSPALDLSKTGSNYKYANVLKEGVGSNTNEDNGLNTRDATQILRYLAKQPSIFTVQINAVNAKIEELQAKVEALNP